MKSPRVQRQILLIAIMSLTFFIFNDTRGKGTAAVITNKPEVKKMFIFPLGRFSIAIPSDLKAVVQTHRFRGCEIREFVWPQGSDRLQVMDRIWHERIKEIGKLEPPEGTRNVIIEERLNPVTKPLVKGVYYYGDNEANDEGYWDLLLDAGPVGVWFKFDGLLEGKEELYNWVLQVAKGYEYRNQISTVSPQKDRYYLKYGAINRPYKSQEHTYARFEGHPLDMKLEIEMQETRHVEQNGLKERLDAAVETNSATGVDIDKIRSKKRTCAGLKGEEMIVRMRDRDKTELTFAWEYAGEVDSGERPEIQITMESPDGQLEEKVRMWDAILDSFKPMYPLTR